MKITVKTRSGDPVQMEIAEIETDGEGNLYLFARKDTDILLSVVREFGRDEWSSFEVKQR